MKRLMTATVAMSLVGCGGGRRESLAEWSQALSQPVAAYAFEEGTAYKTADLSGNGLTGTFYNGAAWTTAGKHGKAVSFSGASFVGVNDAPALRLTSGMTLSAWVNLSGPVIYPRPIVTKQAAGTFSYGLWANSWDANGDYMPSGAYMHGGAVVLNAGTKLVAGTWAYLATTYDGSTLRLYQDGVLTGTRSGPAPIDTSTSWIQIGADSQSGWYLAGKIDDVRIYDRALSLTEIQSDMAIGVGEIPVNSGGSDAGQDVQEASDEREASQDSPADSRDAAAEGAAEAQAPVVDAGPPVVAGPGAAFPLKVAPGNRYLADQSNVPFFINGEAAWSLVVATTDADAETYLEDRRQKGFNAVLVNLVEHHFSANPPANAYGVQPFLTPGDFSTPNDAYFAHADSIVARAASKGMAVLLVPAYLGYQGGIEGWYGDMVASGAAKMATYGQYVGNRYKNKPNIVWVNGGDYNPPDKSLTDAVATGIRSAGASQLQTAHCAPENPAADVWGSKSWLDINNAYTYYSPFVSTLVEYYSYLKPVFLIESHYENERHGTGASSDPPIPAMNLRQQAYDTIMAGGIGNVFGNNPMWGFGYGWPTALTWQGSLNSQGSNDLARFGQFFKTRHWEKLGPDYGHVLYKTSGYSYTALASDGSWGVTYFVSSLSVTYDLRALSIPSVHVSWYDPAVGTYTPVSGSPFPSTGNLNIAGTPGNNARGDSDWVLVFE